MIVLGVSSPALLISRLGFWFLCAFLSLGGYSLHMVFLLFLGLGWPMLCFWALRSSDPRGWLCVLFVFCVLGAFLASCGIEIHYDL